eukprot:3822321-Amphidinium_carterae.1
MVRTELDQSRRQSGLQQLNLRNELAAAEAANAAHHTTHQDQGLAEVTTEVRAMQARNGQLTHELTQANLRVLQQQEEAQQHPHPT